MESIANKYNINTKTIPQKNPMSIQESNNEFISINIKDVNLKFNLSFTKKANMHFMTFQKNNELDNFKLELSEKEYNDFVKSLRKIIEAWKTPFKDPNNYKKTNPTLIWQVELNSFNNSMKYNSIGEVPNNWNQFIDLLSKYEIKYKEQKPESKHVVIEEKIFLAVKPMLKKREETPLPKLLCRKPTNKVTKNDWKTIPMPEKNDSFQIQKLLTEKEIEILKLGHIPKDMDDKWFWYVENDTLYIHRSWTGFCIYIVKLNQNGILDVIVNRDDSQYRCKDPIIDSQNLNALLNFWTRN